MKKFFKLEERNTTVRREVLAGITTFLAMGYILFVNPDMLSKTGMDAGAVFTATALAAAIGTLIMALVANFPIAQAPGMGMNAFFTFSVCIGMGLPWEVALAGIFISGLIFILISVTGIRKAIINAIPISLKYAVGTGIGFFIAFIGLQNAGIIVNSEATLVEFGSLANLNTLLAIIGLIITVILYVRKVNGAIFIGMLATAIIGMLMGLIDLPTAIISTPPSLAPTFGKVFTALGDASTYTFDFVLVVFTFLFVDFFDTAGTIMAVGARAGLVNKETGELIDAEKVLISDALATTTGAVLGTSSVTSFVESLTGVEQGGRTGLTSVTVAVCFLLALFFSPILGVVTSAVTAPALIMVGALMIQSFGHIEWDDIAITIPSFFTVIFMVLSYSIAEGIAVGFLFYTIIMTAKGRSKEVSPIMYGLTVLFLLHYVLPYIDQITAFIVK